MIMIYYSTFLTKKKIKEVIVLKNNVKRVTLI